MAGIISYTWNVIVNSLKDKRALALTFIAPSIIMLVIGYIIITMGSTQTINLGIVNTDQGMGNISASSAIIKGLQSQKSIALVPMVQDELDARMKNKTIDGAVIFGSTFTSDLATKKSTNIKLITEGTDQAKSLAMAGMVSGMAMSVAGQMQKTPTAAPIGINSERYYGNGLAATDFVSPVFMGLITFVLSCLFAILTTTSRETEAKPAGSRVPGPVGRAIAYFSGFSLFAFVQALTVLLYVKYLINAQMAGDIYAVAFILLLLAIVGVSIGVLIATLARSDMQRIPLLAISVVAQMLFGGLIVPISKFSDAIRAFSYALPMTYVNDALQNIVIRGFSLGDVWADWTALIVIAVVALALTSLCLMRNTGVGAIVAKKDEKAI